MIDSGFRTASMAEVAGDSRAGELVAEEFHRFLSNCVEIQTEIAGLP
jgi:hypothetical protein